MEIVFKNFWIFFILVTILNGIILKVRSRKYISENPELKEGYKKYFKGWIFYGNIPWLIMAIGNISGMTENVFEYLNPRSWNPIVLIFHVSVVVLWILGIRWIYFYKGAEFIELHPGLFQKSSFKSNRNLTAKDVKIYYAVAVLSGSIAMIITWMDYIP